MIDASATLPWCFADEATAATEALLERLRSGDEAIAPAHWPTEVMNGLIVAVRRSRITFSQVLQFAEALASLPIHVEAPTPPALWGSLLALAADTGLTIYDAAYLELAMRSASPLASLDGDLQRAARNAAVPLIEPLATVPGPPAIRPMPQIMQRMMPIHLAMAIISVAMPCAAAPKELVCANAAVTVRPNRSKI